DTMNPVCTIMAGRVDDYLKNYIKANKMLVEPEILEWAGVAVVKNAYRIYKERGYRTKLLVAAYRNPYHWHEFIGGDIILTIPYEWQVKYNNSEFPVVETINNPVNEHYLNELKKLDEFNKAYDENGLKPEEFEHYGAFVVTMQGFLKGYDELVQIIRSYMVK
ncbi:MAG: transaldolase, partial [Erysipelotrichaceae bacterium]|nr:transaldolase [Erysipelotrichaceae bacterium]